MRVLVRGAGDVRPGAGPDRNRVGVMAVCDWCKQEMTGKVGCTETEYEIAGSLFTRIPNDDQAPGCHDCAAPLGTLHHPGCDSETCPKCGGQAISCGCEDDDG
jgi:hypothetical protein